MYGHMIKFNSIMNTKNFLTTKMSTQEIANLTLLLSARTSLIEPDADFIEGYKTTEFLNTVAHLYIIMLKTTQQTKPQQVYELLDDTLKKMLMRNSMLSSVCEANVMYVLDKIIKTFGPLKGIRGNTITRVEEMLEETIDKEMIIPADTYERMKLATSTMRCLHERTPQEKPSSN